jgi:hypothetical protein
MWCDQIAVAIFRPWMLVFAQHSVVHCMFLAAKAFLWSAGLRCEAAICTPLEELLYSNGPVIR